MNNLVVRDRVAAPSIFDDSMTFEQSFRMADALSRSQLIPSNFQGKPEDCLIALDFSRRIGLPPTAVLPHLYIIKGRVSMSAQFMIGMVNRSGLFTRIQWDESIEGEIEYSFNGTKRKVPNHRAVAYFTELSTGVRYASPPVDVRFALNNGWLLKEDSKWQKMPSIMCRYRSASLLIKSVCPELALGMEFAEDAEDSPEPTGERNENAIVLTARENEGDEIDEVVEGLRVEISEAQTIDELAAIGEKVAKTGLAGAALDCLRGEFKKRQAELAPKKGGKRAPKKQDAPSGDDYAAAVQLARNAKELMEARDKIEIAFTSGQLSQKEYNGLVDAMEGRARSLEMDSASFGGLDDLEGTEQQKEYARNLLDAISEVGTVEKIDRHIETAKNWEAQGYITSEIFNHIKAFAEAEKANL